ncbi:TPA: hypothetical protein DCG86_07720, partial [Candidatus Marinimicrobia bacterium]|nr:hypothetical protein [Candidatus Neomarinimicrobiota bacterium]
MYILKLNLFPTLSSLFLLSLIFLNFSFSNAFTGTKTFLKKTTTLALIPLMFAFGNENLNKNSLEKVNCPENAEQVITDEQGFKHWKIEDVWYSNRPLEPFYDKIDTVYRDEIRMNPFFQPNDSNLVWYGSGDVDSNNILNENDLTLIQSGIQNDQADIDGDGIP